MKDATYLPHYKLVAIYDSFSTPVGVKADIGTFRFWTKLKFSARAINLSTGWIYHCRSISVTMSLFKSKVQNSDVIRLMV